MIAFAAFLVAAIAAVRAVVDVDARVRAAVVAAAALVVVVVVLVVDALGGGPGGLVLSKTVARVLLPMGLLFAAAWAVAVWRLGSRGPARGAVAVAVAVTVVGNEPLGQGMMQLLEAPYQEDPFAQGTFDAVVVLGGGAQGAAHGHGELGPSGDRVFLGARLFHAHRTPVLVATGTPIAGFLKPFDSLSTTTTLWRDVQVPADAIVTVNDTRTTSEEARAVAALVRERGWTRVGLVTSAWHMRRAERLFRAAGVDVVPVAADHRGEPTWEGLYSVVPVGNGAYLQQKAAWEWIGALVGR
jgi:uncharacterized SAM-binding protein YcdF (DUF218 family)